jgi:hypothetical protein
MKTCTKCQTLKTFSEFHKYSKSLDGYKHHCRDCVKKYDDKEHDPKRKFSPKEKDGLLHCRKCDQYLDKSKFWGSNRSYCRECSVMYAHVRNVKQYGITPEQFIELSEKQDNLCAICNNPEQNNKRLCIDHDHLCCSGRFSCGKCIRGLICTRCNKTLGMANDDIVLLQYMIDYLQK